MSHQYMTPHQPQAHPPGLHLIPPQQAGIIFPLCYYTGGTCSGDASTRQRMAGTAVAMREVVLRRRIYCTAALKPTTPYPTEDKAKLVAILLALQDAQSEYFRLPRGPNQMKVTIYTDSQYAKDCMKGPIRQWKRNDWRDDNGQLMENADILSRVEHAQRELCCSGSVEYILTPRADFMYAEMMEMLRAWERGAVLPSVVL